MEMAPISADSRSTGRPRACGPCHRRKVACDRSRPTCGSCKRRRRKAPCEYESEPLQQSATITPGPTSSGAAQSSPASLETPVPRVVSPSPATPVNDLPTCSHPISVNDGAALPSQASGVAEPQITRSGSPPRPGYLGFTSFLGIYEEARTTVALPSPHQSSQLQHRNESRLTTEREKFGLSDITLQSCRNLLRNVPPKHEANILFDAHFGPHDAWIRPLARRMLDSFFDSFGRFLDPIESNEQSLDALSDLLSRNTTKRFSDNEQDTEEWIDQFIGANFRWESLGVLFVYWELGSRRKRQSALKIQTATEEDAMYGRCVSDCLSLSRSATTTGNILVVYLYYKRMIIDSVFSGDASKSQRNAPAPQLTGWGKEKSVVKHVLTVLDKALSCWSFHAETIAAMTFLGFHVENDEQMVERAPTLSSEFQRRLFCFVFNTDKVLASFTGRPPLLSSRYVSTRLPLDLADEWLLSDREIMARKVGELDDNGWSQDDAIYPVSPLRARFSFAIIRDEVFEIALAVGAKPSETSLLELKARQVNTLAGLPRKLLFNTANFDDLTIDAETLYTRLLIHLEHLQNLFFIERLRCRAGHVVNDDLLQVSFEMVSTTVMFWTNMDRLSAIHHDFMWLVMAYAAPGGGVLCLNLLKPGELGTQKSTGITRSAIVQQLSLLVGFLGWVKPYASNGDLCANCKTVIQAVLDYSLNHPVDTPYMPPVIADWGLPGQLDFDFDLMDTFEWLRTDIS